jgi:hypothetical protein
MLRGYAAPRSRLHIAASRHSRGGTPASPARQVFEDEFLPFRPWACVRFTRHAKNKARSLGLSIADAERVIETADRIDFDGDGLPRYTGYVDGLRVRVVVALDDPQVIVTIHERRN